MQLSGNTFLVTGGGSGLGAGCARRFAEAGANVVIADVNETAGNDVAQSIGQRAVFLKTDVTSTADVEAAIQMARDRFGGLHGAVNCAGILYASRVVGKEGPHDLAAFARVIQVNLIGTFNVLRLTAAALVNNTPNADGERGVLINTASVSAFEGQIGQAAYSASKGGVASMMLPMARELSKFGIRVVAIAPGIFETPMMQAAPDNVRQSLLDQIPFPKRFGQPAEYAALAQFIIENAMFNGSTIRLDGAVRMSSK